MLDFHYLKVIVLILNIVTFLQAFHKSWGLVLNSHKLFLDIKLTVKVLLWHFYDIMTHNCYYLIKSALQKGSGCWISIFKTNTVIKLCQYYCKMLQKNLRFWIIKVTFFMWNCDQKSNTRRTTFFFSTQHFIYIFV